MESSAMSIVLCERTAEMATPGYEMLNLSCGVEAMTTTHLLL